MPPAEKITRARRHKSAVACQACRQRKVRCSLTVTGVPCAGCTQDGAQCIVDLNRAKATKKRDQPTNHAHPASSTGFHSNVVNTTPNPSVQLANGSPNIESFRARSGQSTPAATNASSSNIEDEERNGLEIAAAALGKPQRMGEVPFYTGDQTGPTSALNISSSDQSLPKHFLIPASITQLSDEDWEFLRSKGVYALPKAATCDSLIMAYLFYVHPIMPVIEADVLLSHHRSGKLAEYNFLILWSVFFVAVNFIPSDVFQAEGYVSRREMKDAMYSRAKESDLFTVYMYRNGNERNKIVLLQSSLILGFYHSEVNEHGQPWYWTGIAISLCQILGLHRNLDSSKRNSAITERQRLLWRRLWWSCFFRDRWLGLTMGRPLRINLDDCDTPSASPGDLLYDIDGLPDAVAVSYIPSDMPRLAKYWVMLIGLSKQLGDVLSTNYRVGRKRPSMHEIADLERQLLRCELPDQYEAGLTRASRFYVNHIHLHYQALLITFYRPFGIDAPFDLQPTERDDWQHRMRSRADAAASRTNEIVETLVQEKLLEFAGPMTPPLLVPAMQTHLFQCKFGDRLSKRMRLNKLEMCMLVMEEFQKTYPVGSFYLGVFSKAIEQIFPGYSAPSLSSSSSMINHTGVPVETGPGDLQVAPGTPIPMAQFDETEFGRLEEGDMMNALMDEASIFSFWDTWNPE
ncbi:fungal-specific transcription factor domain-containing protein [Penicillium hispanicum]|uniref:fungal-specific transcription factor domain-containing protein n=1 Tax=Penicillium hispanicum TaxID=1080232 RepID=UPI002541626E|nr:fungal-specific transcription factor domain-containing protein [Penicillium hispanicum]KAJ5578146.1 fungal-specific transcription factor domain-containing protein [Penicillium hispanicum]